MKKLSFVVGGILATFGHLNEHYKEELKNNYMILDRGYNSFATNLPGSPYQKTKKASKTLSEILTWIIKYLHDKPEILEAVKTEQEANCQSNENGKSHLTWNQTGNMPLTNKVLFALVRQISW